MPGPEATIGAGAGAVAWKTCTPELRAICWGCGASVPGQTPLCHKLQNLGREPFTGLERRAVFSTPSWHGPPDGVCTPRAGLGPWVSTSRPHGCSQHRNLHDKDVAPARRALPCGRRSLSLAWSGWQAKPTAWCEAELGSGAQLWWGRQARGLRGLSTMLGRAQRRSAAQEGGSCLCSLHVPGGLHLYGMEGCKGPACAPPFPRLKSLAATQSWAGPGPHLWGWKC